MRRLSSVKTEKEGVGLPYREAQRKKMRSETAQLLHTIGADGISLFKRLIPST